MESIISVRLPTDRAFTANQLVKLATAIETMERLVPGFDIHFEPHEANGGLALVDTPPRPPSLGQSKRALVVQATAEFATVQEICQQAGLKPKDVRGVLSATDLEFDIDASGGRKRYKFAGKRPRPSRAQSDCSA